jgi:hypothetical protein
MRSTLYWSSVRSWRAHTSPHACATYPAATLRQTSAHSVVVAEPAHVDLARAQVADVRGLAEDAALARIDEVVGQERGERVRFPAQVHVHLLLLAVAHRRGRVNRHSGATWAGLAVAAAGHYPWPAGAPPDAATPGRLASLCRIGRM